MRPFLESLPWTEESSIALLDRRLDDEIPFQWHHHPEWELTLTLNSTGQRFIGDHVGNYGHGDLVLVAPNLPHTWVSHDRVEPGPHRASVIWFRQDWIETLGGMAEWRALTRLAENGQRGLAFSGDMAQMVAPRIQSILTQDPAERVVTLLGVLVDLADDQATPLASTPAHRDPEGASRDRINRVLTHVHTHYTRPLPIDDLAQVAALSPSGLHRLFKRQMNRTISDYVMGLRVGAAAARLAGGDEPIAYIAADIGYGELANFNRQFRAAKGMSPRTYRARFR